MRDPGLQSLRRATRVAIVVPVLFAFFLNGVDNPVAALFASFGSFALLGFADFGGPPRPRARAYLVLALLGAVLVVVGTVVSNSPVVGALIGVAVATAARFAGCFGGYFGASVSPVILAYVLAASVPARTTRCRIGFSAGSWPGSLATLAALVLWPRRERMLVREAAATAAGAVADARRPHCETARGAGARARRDRRGGREAGGGGVGAPAPGGTERARRRARVPRRPARAGGDARPGYVRGRRAGPSLTLELIGVAATGASASIERCSGRRASSDRARHAGGVLPRREAGRDRRTRSTSSGKAKRPARCSTRSSVLPGTAAAAPRRVGTARTRR